MRHAIRFFILSFLTACSPSEKRDTTDKNRDTRDSIRTVVASRYPGINEFSAIDDPYLFVVQKQMQSNRHFLFKGFALDDITEGDSLWMVSFRGTNGDGHLLNLSCASETALGLLNAFDTPGRSVSRRGNRFPRPSAIVAVIDTLQRVRFTVTSTIDSEGEEIYSNLSMDLSNPLLFTGRLIEVH